MYRPTLTEVVETYRSGWMHRFRCLRVPAQHVRDLPPEPQVGDWMTVRPDPDPDPESLVEAWTLQDWPHQGLVWARVYGARTREEVLSWVEEHLPGARCVDRPDAWIPDIEVAIARGIVQISGKAYEVPFQYEGTLDIPAQHVHDIPTIGILRGSVEPSKFSWNHVFPLTWTGGGEAWTRESGARDGAWLAWNVALWSDNEDEDPRGEDGLLEAPGTTMTPVEASGILRERLAPYAVPDSFSFHFDSKRADLQCEVEAGRTTGLRLTPARVTLALAFDHRSGARVSMKVEEATLEDIVYTVGHTVEALLETGEAS